MTFTAIIAEDTCAGNMRNMFRARKRTSAMQGTRESPKIILTLR